jgi:Ice-binding-like/IPTL-CTERM motif
MLRIVSSPYSSCQRNRAEHFVLGVLLFLFWVVIQLRECSMSHFAAFSQARLGLLAICLVSVPALAQTLGAAQSFAVLGGSAVNANGATSTVNGDVGVSPGSSITGFPTPANVVAPFTFAHAADGPANNARAATLTLYNALAAAGGAVPILPGLAGQVLAPGTYTTGAALLTSGGTLTLSGSGVYIFQVTSSLTTVSGSNVVLVGVDPCDIFWQVSTLATLDGGAFPGNVVAQTGIHLGTGASLSGRALAAAAGDVTMAGSNSVGGCSAPGPGLAATAVGTAASAAVQVGGTITDTATVSGGGLGTAAPTGTITFNLYGPADATCTAAAIFTSVVPVNGNGSYTSAPYVTPAIGSYRWIANYSGDLNNLPTTNACNAPNETVVVTAGPPVITSAAIPTLSEWALLVLGTLLALSGFAAVRRVCRIRS